jgi:fatty-acid peroxygenase
MVVSGSDGTKLFYDESRMARHRAVPALLANTLFGRGALHGLDGPAHQHRKALFLTLLTPAAAASIADRARSEWQAMGSDGADAQPISLFDTAHSVHAAAVCAWAGVPEESLDESRTRDLIAMVDGFGSIGLRQVRARRARRHADAWARRLIERERAS